MSPLPSLRLVAVALLFTLRLTFLALAFRLALRRALDFGIDVEPTVRA
jgi:hypothetical protein